MLVGYTPASLHDLTTIGDFIALENRKRARSFIAELRGACQSLRTESSRYPLQPQWPGVRRMPVGNYLIFYRVLGDSVQILRVLHSARETRDVTFPN